MIINYYLLEAEELLEQPFTFVYHEDTRLSKGRQIV
jgi:hypothetical protein